MKIRVAIAHDWPILREGMRTVLAAQSDMELVAVGGEADVIVAGPAVDCIHALRERYVRARLVLLTTRDDEEAVYHTVHVGAQGYVLESDPASALVDAVRAVHAGRRYLTARPAERLVQHVGACDLTAREHEVLELLAAGHSNRRIALHLGISEETVKGHVKRILSKLGARRRTEAASIAIRRGLVRPE